MDSRADVLVIGGGPAGTTVGMALKSYRPDARIVLAERDVFPRHHVGESMLPDTRRVLRKLGLLEAVEAAGFQRKTGITYKWRHDRPMFSEEFADAGGGAGEGAWSWQVDRSRYDQLLLDHARQRGVEVLQPCTVGRVILDGERPVGAELDGPGGRTRLEFGHVVDCSGQSRLLARALGIERTPQELGDLALYRYYDGPGWDEQILGSRTRSKIFFATAPAGWVWLIPLSPTLKSVGLVTRRELVRSSDLDGLLDEQIRSVPEMERLLRDAKLTSAPGSSDGVQTRSVANWSYTQERTAGPGWYLAGDAAAFVDPILSSGIHVAHRSAINAANAVATEWLATGVDHAELHRAYHELYSDLCAGFILMARWWYEQREAGIEDWWRAASALARGAGYDRQGGVEAFMAFASGYFSDFRLEQIGPGFGKGGFSVCLDGLVDEAGIGERAFGRDPARNRALEPRFGSVTGTDYLGTLVESDRWWRMPAVTFKTPRGDRLYRVPVAAGDDEPSRSGLALERLAALLDAVDGERGFNDVVEIASGDEGARGPVGKMASQLLSLGLLVEVDRESRVGSSAAELAERHAPLELVSDAVEWSEARCVELGPSPHRRVELRYMLGGVPGCYRLSPGSRAEEAARALLAALDGRTGADEIVRRVRRSVDPDDRAVHDSANLVLADLVSLGVVRYRSAPAAG